MAITKNFLMLIFMATALSGRAMEVINPPAPATNIAFENNIRLVFMGRTGAGKSTLINAFYNYAKKVKWNDHPKLFPIPTEFQHCNVVEYQGRNAENHTAGQREAVTQEPSEYVSRGQSFVISLIDCPGMADPRGPEQDIINTTKISEFMKRVGDFNAILIVLPVSVNRETIETKYFIEQVKTIIPVSAHNRIFIGVSFSTAEDANVIDFVRSVGLSVENMFYFDNYAISKNGYRVDLNVNLDGGDEDIDDPFGAQDGALNRLAQQKKVNDAKLVKQSWINSNQEFNRMLRKAKDLGKYTSADIARITEIKNSVKEKISEAYRKIESIEDGESKLVSAQARLSIAIENYNLALSSKNSADIEYQKAQIEKQSADALAGYENYSYPEECDTDRHNTNCLKCAQVCHEGCNLKYISDDATDHLTGCGSMSDNRCKVCHCYYDQHRHRFKAWRTVTQTRPIPGVSSQKSNANSNYDTWQQKCNSRAQDVNTKQQDKDSKNTILTDITDRLNCLKIEKDDLQRQIVELYVRLSQVSMSSIYFQIGEYYDLCIRNEPDITKRAKLNRDRAFYTEQVELFKRRMAQNNT